MSEIYSFMRYWILMLLTMACAHCRQPKSNILIVGDSISIGYTPYVQKNLADLAEVIHNPGNAEHTGTGVDSIVTWVGNKDWDIILFNWGLWDLCYRHPDSNVQGHRDKINGTITLSVDEYGDNLDSIITLIRNRSTAELIFVTTTYVPKMEAGRYQEDVIKYNDKAKSILNKRGVTILDIYDNSILIHRQYGKGNDDVHYTEEGYKKLGDQISDFLKQEIQHRRY